MYDVKVEDLIGKVFTKVYISENKDEMIFENDTEIYNFYHDQYCCEYVSIEDVVGDLRDLENSPIVMSEEVSRTSSKTEYFDHSKTWFFTNMQLLKDMLL